MKIIKFAKNPYTSILLNFAYAVGNCVLGFFAHSWWFITVGVYYTVLAIARFFALQVRRKANGDYDTELFARRITGILLVVLSFCIVGVNIMSAVKDRGTAFHEIVMITIATYTFSKITIAIIGMVKAKRSASPVLTTLRNISLADACVSIYTMQRSMLVSFPGMKATEILLLNIFTGTAVWIVVLLLGINLIGGKYTDRRIFFLGIAKAFWNHRHCRWFSLTIKCSGNYARAFLTIQQVRIEYCKFFMFQTSIYFIFLKYKYALLPTPEL